MEEIEPEFHPHSDYYYSEWAEYRNDEEKTEVHNYLELWKKFNMRKLEGMELINALLVDKSFFDDVKDPLKQRKTVGIKLHMRKHENNTP